MTEQEYKALCKIEVELTEIKKSIEGLNRSIYMIERKPVSDLTIGTNILEGVTLKKDLLVDALKMYSSHYYSELISSNVNQDRLNKAKELYKERGDTLKIIDQITVFMGEVSNLLSADSINSIKMDVDMLQAQYNYFTKEIEKL